jgi:adenylate cyclase class 2
MNIEFEATFPNVDKDKIREKLRKINAQLVKPELLQKRSVYRLPSGHEINGGWLRVRDEGDKVTMSLKVVDGDKIENQKEVCLTVDNFKQAELLLITIGCEKKAYQESKRELWKFDNVEITIDEWPFLEPFVEIEGKSKQEVKKVSELLGFEFNKALFCAVDTLYSQKYAISKDWINNKTPSIVFNEENPFLNNSKLSGGVSLPFKGSKDVDTDNHSTSS